MQSTHDHPKGAGRVLPFVRPGGAWPGAQTRAQPRPVEDLGKFEQISAESDDYRHRQITNLAALVVCVLLIVGGIWLANKIAELRRDQDCVLAGRRNCAQISVSGSAR